MGKRGRPTGIDYEAVRKLWDEGVPTYEIGRRFGVHRNTVYEHARYHKWPKRRVKMVPTGEFYAGRHQKHY